MIHGNRKNHKTHIAALIFLLLMTAISLAGHADESGAADNSRPPEPASGNDCAEDFGTIANLINHGQTSWQLPEGEILFVQRPFDQNFVVYIGNERLTRLTAAESGIWLAFLERPNRHIPVVELYRASGADPMGKTEKQIITNTVSMISRLRRKLGPIGRHIKTTQRDSSSGAGYRLELPEELVSKGAAAAEETGFGSKHYRYNPQTFQSRYKNQPVKLQKVEQAILHKLIAADGVLVPTTELFELLKTESTDEKKLRQLLHVYIYRINRKLVQAGADGKPIKNKKGKGFRFIDR